MNAPNDTSDLRLLSTEQLLNTQGPKWLVPGLVPEGGVTCFFGPAGAGKTSVAIDLAVSLATNQPFLSRSTQQCGVLFFNLEGNIRDRVQVAFQERQVDPSSKETYIAWCLDSSINLCGDSARSPLKSVVDGFRKSVPIHLPIVVIMDNLAAAMHGADENNIVGVGTALSTLRYACGHATVIVVHHSGHDTTRLRGHSVLQGSFDAIIRVGNSKAMQPARLLEVGKQRDASDNVLPIRFTLSPVGITGRPEEETACVVKCAPHVPRKPADTPSANESSQLSDVARLVFDTFSPLSRGDPVPEKLLKEAVIKQVMTTSGDPVSKEAAAKRYLRGRDALLKDGKLLRDPANQANLQLAA